MMKNWVLLTLLCLSSTQLFADEYLIQEMESLKSSLAQNDPDRTELSLRLADLYFDVSIQEGDGNLIEKREKSLLLYTHVLEGKDGLIAPKGEKATLIKYQMARVLNKLNRFDRARDFYKAVYDTDKVSKKLKREAAFSLAEYYEEKVNFNKSNHFYKSAINLCETIESCNYAHYKRAWLLYKEVKLELAIAELKLSLWDKNGSARDKVIKDLLLFFSANMTNGEPELAYIKELRQKTGKKNLVRDLVESFYATGNRIAGSVVLEQLNAEEPDAFYEMRLVEEFYGFREMDRVKKYLSALDKRSQRDIPTEKEEAKEFKAMLKRIVVQLDSEVEQDKSFTPVLLNVIDRYLVFYPNDDMRKKLQQGWLKVQTDRLKKIDRLALWIDEDIKFGFKSEEIRKLRQTRLALAQKEKLNEIVILESLAIASILKGTPEAREFNYTAAREYYKDKRYDEALELFIPLAKIESFTTSDKFSLLSQNLALDIYNIKKDYASILAQTNSWLSIEGEKAPKSIKKELKQMKLVNIQAEFEQTAALGETKEALDKFFSYCYSNVFIEKSCSNAKILSVKLQDQAKLVTLLESSPVKSLRDEKALMVEYELMGRFTDSARIQEKYNLNKNADIPTYLKLAVLYEIDADFKNRNRILKKMMAKLKRDKRIEPSYEAAILKTLSDADLINTQSLVLPWSVDNKLAIARRLSSQKTNSKLDKIIMSQMEYSGSRWSKIVLSKIEKQYKRISKLTFHGRNSERRFKRKVKAIEKLITLAKPYLDGANAETRIYLLDMMKLSYQNLGAEILNTPLPDGLTEDVLMQVQAKLTTMATPYSTVAADYENLQSEQFVALSEEIRAAISNNISTTPMTYSNFIKDDEFKDFNTSGMSVSAIDFKGLEEAKAELLQTPGSVTTLAKMESFFKEQNSERIALYFTGRINSLKEKQ